jgi:hypothetical protein
MLILPIVFVRPFSMGHRSAKQPFKNLSFLPPPPKPAKRRLNWVFSKFFSSPWLFCFYIVPLRSRLALLKFAAALVFC